MPVIGWKLDEAERPGLLERFPPLWPDGGVYHITWSLDRGRGREAVQSNDVIADLGWRRLPDPVPIRIIPARF